MSEQQAPEAGIPTPRKLRVLLVDDEIDLAFSLKMGLEQSGFIVDSFTDPEEALSNFKTDLYNAALIDVEMPNINGFDLCEKLRKIDEKVRYCFTTAYVIDYETLKKDYPWLNSIKCHIQKPIETDDLVRKINEVLQKPI